MDTCPVCGFNELPPVDHALCRCCNSIIRDGLDAESARVLCDRWIAGGALFFGPRMPTGWDAYTQLLKAGIINRGGAFLAGVVPLLRASA